MSLIEHDVSIGDHCHISTRQMVVLKLEEIHLLEVTQL